MKTYVCRRARLCSHLIECGFRPYKIVPDKDNPHFDVYLFDATPALYDVVLGYVKNDRFNGGKTEDEQRTEEKTI